MTPARERIRVLLATARTNPEFARRLAEAVPAAVRPELSRTLAQPAPTASRGPGVAKCRPARRNVTPMSAQLNLFARSVSRVT